MQKTNGNAGPDPHAQQLAALKGAQAKYFELERGLADVRTRHAGMIAKRPTLSAAAYVDKKPGAADELRQLNGQIRGEEDAVLGYEHQMELTQAEIHGIEAAIVELERQGRQAQLVVAQAELAQAQAVAASEIAELGRKFADVDHCYRLVKELQGNKGETGDGHAERVVWRPLNILVLEMLTYYPLEAMVFTTRQAKAVAQQLAEAVPA